MRTESPNVELCWVERAERVARSQARTNPVGMTRLRRDADERAFLAMTGQQGPFVESILVVEPVIRRLPE